MTACTAVTAIVLSLAAPAAEIGPAEWLRAQPKPRFREGHTQPRLTRFGWTLPLDTRIELAESWGYTLEFGGYADGAAVDRALNDPESDEGKMVALAAKDPKRYSLGVILSRELPRDPPPETWTRDEKGEFLGGKERVWSPEAPLGLRRRSRRVGQLLPRQGLSSKAKLLNIFVLQINATDIQSPP